MKEAVTISLMKERDKGTKSSLKVQIVKLFMQERFGRGNVASRQINKILTVQY